MEALELGPREVVDLASIPWHALAEVGVQRFELAHQDPVTTWVLHCSPGSELDLDQFEASSEILVLKGDLRESGSDYPVGSFLRGPSSSLQGCGSREGCVLLLRQVAGGDESEPLRLQASAVAWQKGPALGLQVIPLHTTDAEDLSLLRWQPGSSYEPHRHADWEEILVLEGVLQDEHGTYGPGTWLRYPPGSEHHPWSDLGCTIWLRTSAPTRQPSSPATQSLPSPGRNLITPLSGQPWHEHRSVLQHRPRRKTAIGMAREEFAVTSSSPLTVQNRSTR